MSSDKAEEEQESSDTAPTAAAAQPLQSPSRDAIAPLKRCVYYTFAMSKSLHSLSSCNIIYYFEERYAAVGCVSIPASLLRPALKTHNEERGHS